VRSVQLCVGGDAAQGVPHHDAGVEVRRIFHKLSSEAVEPFNGLFENGFAWLTQMPMKGLQRSQLLVLGAIVIYQLVLFSINTSTTCPLPRALCPC
jgi:hypothetical protein